LFETLKTENRQHIATLGDRLSPGQTRLLGEANRTQDLEQMIRLSQRLRALANNAQILESNTEAAYGGTEAVEATRGRRARRARTGLNERHADASAEYEGIRESTTADIAAIDAELAPILEQIAALESEREGMHDPNTEVQAARARAQEMRRQLDRMGRPRRDSPDREEFDTLRAERIAVLDSIANLRVDQRDYRRAQSDLRNQIRAINRLTIPLRRRRTRAERRQESAEGELPYGLVHTGGLGSQQGGRMTGSLADLYSLREMRQFITAEQQEGGTSEGGGTE
jgi:predicted  nucleic acid-binding Zn-ribbon protein